MSDTGTVIFKEWLPDLPELNNPGLTEAKGVIPVDGSFRNFLQFGTAMATAAAFPQGAFGTAVFSTNAGLYDAYTYFGTQTKLYFWGVSDGTIRDRSGSTYNGSPNSAWCFTQFDDLVIASNYEDRPQYQTVASASNFTALSSSAPQGQQIGVVSRFVVVGNTKGTAGGGGNAYIQWSGIDAPTNWPTPNSATAIAVQSGEQYFDEQFGPVTGIGEGDQFGIIFQAHAIHRMTYVGGNVVFQFDRISSQIGCNFPFSIVKVGGVFYFASDDGIMVTDGVSVKPVGYGKVDRYFLANVARGNDSFPFVRHRMRGAADIARNLVYFAYPEANSSTAPATQVLVLNTLEQRFSHAAYTTQALHSVPRALTAQSEYLRGFNDANVLAQLNGSPATGILTTGETEPNPGGFSRVQALKAIVDATINAVTLSDGGRNDLTSAVTYATDQTANSRTGFANFRSEYRYHRARVTIAGTFNAAQGLEYQAVPSGEV